jgi:hypothetical protein
MQRAAKGGVFHLETRQVEHELNVAAAARTSTGISGSYA